MQTLFECKVRYVKTDQNSGKEKPVTETYLFDALSYTEAEERVYKQMQEIVSGDFAVTSIRKAKYSEILPSDDGDRWFRGKVSFISYDEKSGKERKSSHAVLVLATDIKDAFDKIIQGMNGATDDFYVNAIAESPVLDYFPIFEKEEQ